MLAPQVARRCANPPRTIPLLLAHPAPPIPRSLAARPRRQKQPKRRSALSISAARFNPSPVAKGSGCITSSCVLRLREWPSLDLLGPFSCSRTLQLVLAGLSLAALPISSIGATIFSGHTPPCFVTSHFPAASFFFPPCPLEHSCTFASHSYRKSVTREELIPLTASSYIFRALS